MAIQESGEMYLETLLILSQGDREVHSVDVGDYMGFSKPSVSRAMKNLRDGGYIEMSPSGVLTLTANGRALAEKIYERHRLIKAVLMELGVSEQIAAEDACRIEHDISDESILAIKRHFNQN